MDQVGTKKVITAEEKANKTDKLIIKSVENRLNTDGWSIPVINDHKPQINTFLHRLRLCFGCRNQNNAVSYYVFINIQSIILTNLQSSFY